MAIIDYSTRQILQSSETTPLGSILLAAFIRNGDGLRRDQMRVLGCYALVLMTEGRGRYAVPGAEPILFGPGDVVVVVPEVGHTYGPADGAVWSEFYVMFAGPVFDLWRGAGLLPVGPALGKVAGVDQTLGRLLAALAEPSAVGRVARFQTVLADLFSTPVVGTGNATDAAFVAAAQKALTDAAARGRSVQQVAREMKLSYETFRKRFMRLTGTPPAKFLARCVITRASDLLHRRELSVRDVALACGFCDEFHLSRRFRQMMGMAPTEFRKNLGVR
jgi:AraC-like DNA-binding protein